MVIVVMRMIIMAIIVVDDYGPVMVRTVPVSVNPDATRG